MEFCGLQLCPALGLGSGPARCDGFLRQLDYQAFGVFRHVIGIEPQRLKVGSHLSHHAHRHPVGALPSQAGPGVSMRCEMNRQLPKTR